MTADQIAAIAATVIATLLAGAVAGLVLMFRQVGELKIALQGLTLALEQVTLDNREGRERHRQENRDIHDRIDRLKAARAAGC